MASGEVPPKTVKFGKLEVAAASPDTYVHGLCAPDFDDDSDDEKDGFDDDDCKAKSGGLCNCRQRAAKMMEKDDKEKDVTPSGTIKFKSSLNAFTLQFSTKEDLALFHKYCIDASSEAIVTMDETKSIYIIEYPSPPPIEPSTAQ